MQTASEHVAAAGHTLTASSLPIAAIQVEADAIPVASVPWTSPEPEAGEVEIPKAADPRLNAPSSSSSSPAAGDLVLPCPLFPFLPSKSSLPHSQPGMPCSKAASARMLRQQTIKSLCFELFRKVSLFLGTRSYKDQIRHCFIKVRPSHLFTPELQSKSADDLLLLTLFRALPCCT